MPRTSLTTLALLCSGVAAFLTLWIVVPAPLHVLWIVGVGASEWSLWFGALGLLGAALGLVAMISGGRVLGLLAVALGLLAAIFAAVPLIQSQSIAQATEATLSLRQYVLGTDLPTVVAEEVTFATVDGQDLALDVYAAPSSNDPRPAIIVVHGGSWSGGNKSDFPRWNQWLVEHGYVVFDIEYRVAPQPNWQTATGDVKCAVGWVKQNAANYNVDPDRIALLGRSAGGHLALLAAYTPDEPLLAPSCDAPDTSVEAVISFYGPTDLIWGYNNPANPDIIDGPGTLRRFIGGDPETHSQEFRVASPVTQVDQTTPPTLLVHGGRDQLVGARHMTLLAEQLQNAGVPHRTVLIPYGQHGFDYNFNGWGSQIVQPILQQFLMETIGSGDEHR